MRTFLAIGVLALLVGAVEAETIEMKVNGLVCGFCAQGIEKTFQKNPATADVLVSLEDRLVAVATREGQTISDEDLKKALKESGYEVKEIKRTQVSLEDIRARLEKKHE